jgi:hypothetical protein
MRIATFNINGINARFPALLQWLSETSPDIVFLQELKAPEKRFPKKGGNGVAILGKETNRSKECGSFPAAPTMRTRAASKRMSAD